MQCAWRWSGAHDATVAVWDARACGESVEGSSRCSGDLLGDGRG